MIGWEVFGVLCLLFAVALHVLWISICHALLVTKIHASLKQKYNKKCLIWCISLSQVLCVFRTLQIHPVTGAVAIGFLSHRKFCQCEYQLVLGAGTHTVCLCAVEAIGARTLLQEKNPLFHTAIRKSLLYCWKARLTLCETRSVRCTIFG